MRKSIITICAIVLLTAALCVYTTATLNDSVAHLQSIAADMQQNFDNGDYAACMDDAQRFWTDWRRRFARLASLIPHDDLDDVSLSITTIWHKLRHGETDGLSAEIGILGENLDHLVHTEEFRWDNLL